MNRPTGTPKIKNLEFKVGALLIATVLLLTAFLLYSLYARGAFHATQSLILVAPEAGDVTIGMPMTFSGFPIGTVKRMDLGEDGNVRLEIAVPIEDSRWLRESSVFTLEKGMIGGAKIKAHTTDLSDKPLPPGASRTLYTGDATQEIPVLVDMLKSILTNVAKMTDQDSQINRTLANVQSLTQRMTGEYGMLEGVLGSPDKAAEVVTMLNRANNLLGSLNGVTLKLDDVLGKTDTRLYGTDGIMDQTQQSIAKVNTLLSDVSVSLGKADALLAHAEKAGADLPRITANVSAATTDMVQLRAEIDDSVRKVNHLINELNRKWPFARDVEIRTP